jgi:FixJ family two-component response regulator
MSHDPGPRRKRPTIIVVGGDAACRADICFTTSRADLHIEPVADVTELTARDFAVADVFLVWNDPALLEAVKSRMAIASTRASLVAFQRAPMIEAVVSAMLAGAVGFIEWPCTPDKLERAIEAAIDRRHAALPRWERTLRAKARLARLSGRERQVITAATDGLSNKQIAQQLSLSPRTIEIHRSNAIRKLEVGHTIDAVRLVIEAAFESSGNDRFRNDPNPGAGDDEIGKSRAAKLA